MFHLLPCEWSKVWKKPVFLTCIFAMLAVNILLLWYTGSNQSISHSAYQTVTKELSSLNGQERTEWIKTQQERASALYALEQIELLQAGAGSMSSYQTDLLMQENPNLEQYRAEYQNGAAPKYTGSFEAEKAFWDEIAQDSVTQEEYANFLTDVQKDADSLSGISIFADGEKESYEQKSIRQTADQYQKLSRLSVLPGQSKGILTATNAVSTDCILLLLLLLFVVLLVVNEKQKGLFPLIRSTSKGRAETMAAKSIVFLCTSGLLTLLFWGSNLVYCALTMGLDRFFRPVQSIAFFIGCPYSVSVAGYLFFFFLTKWFSYLIFGGSVLLISVVFDKVSTVGFVTAVVFGIETIFYFGIAPLSPYRLLRILNVFNLMQTGYFYSTYSTINVFGNPVSAVFLTWTVLVFAGILLFLFAILIYSWKKKTSSGPSLLQQIRKRFPKLRFRPSASLWKQEAYKLLVVNKGILLALVFVCLIFPKITQHSAYLPPDELYYKSYMENLSGKLTEEKESYLQAEQQKFAEAQGEILRIEQLYQDKKITEIQRIQLEQPYQTILNTQNAFFRVMQYYDHMKLQKEGTFLYDTGYLHLFQGNHAIYLALIIFCALCFSNLFSMELQNGAMKLIRTLPQGRSNTIRCKVVLSLFLCIGMTCAAYGMELFSIHEVYGLNQWSAPVSSIPLFSSLPSWMSLWEYVTITLALKLIAMVSSTLIVLLVSSKSKNGLIAMMLSLFLLAAPVALFCMGMDYMQYLSFFPLTMSNMLLTVNGRFTYVAYLAVAAISAVLSMFVLKKNFGLTN